MWNNRSIFVLNYPSQAITVLFAIDLPVARVQIVTQAVQLRTMTVLQETGRETYAL